MPVFEIRTYRSSDLADLKAIFLDAVHRGAAKDYTPEQLNAWAPKTLDVTPWQKRMQRNRCWLALLNNTPVGFTELIDRGHIQMLFVHSDHHRQGIARALLQKLESTAVELGLQKLTTEASRTARPFFERSGYDLITAQTVVIQDIEIENFRMAKNLQRRAKKHGQTMTSD